MLGKDDSFHSTLAEIASAIVEYDLHLDQKRLVNFIDLYRVYLQQLPEKQARLKTRAVSVTFQQFIFDQPLLDKSAAAVAKDTGEQVNAPAALHVVNS